jgi:YggT family protein
MTTTTTTKPADTASPTPRPASTNINVSTARTESASIWTASRVVALVFSVLEVLLLVRFVFKLFGANPQQGFASAIYGITEPLVAPFRGIFSQPDGTSGVEIATLLSIVFFVLIAALIVAMVRAFTGKRGEHEAEAA